MCQSRMRAKWFQLGKKSFSVCKEEYLTENKEWVAMEPVGR